MTESERSVLVCYASGTGCTKEVAERIASAISETGLRVDLAPVGSSPDPGRYGAVVVGSGTRAGSWPPAARRWLVRNADALRLKTTALFTVGIAMAAGTDEKRAETLHVTDRLVERTRLRPIGVGAFAGWYVPAKFSFIERRIMRIAHAPEGDHRDWQSIERWAREIAPSLAASVPGAAEPRERCGAQHA